MNLVVIDYEAILSMKTISVQWLERSFGTQTHRQTHIETDHVTFIRD